VEPGPPLRDVRCFTAVARHLGFSPAAAELNLSQPAVSQAVARLERLWQVRLFERTSREVRLTAAGRTLLPHAEALLDAAAALSAEAARLAAPAIRIAYSPTVGTLVARAVRRLARRRPPIEVELRPCGRAAATAALARGEVAAAVISAPFPEELTTAVRFHVPVGHLAVPADDPLASVSVITPERLGRHRLLMPRERPPGSMWARLAERLPGTRLGHVVADDLDDFAAALDLVAAGAGLLPTPSLLVKTVRRPDIRFVPFDAGELRITYGLAWPAATPSPVLMSVVRAVQESLWTR